MGVCVSGRRYTAGDLAEMGIQIVDGNQDFVDQDTSDVPEIPGIGFTEIEGQPQQTLPSNQTQDLESPILPHPVKPSLCANAKPSHIHSLLPQQPHRATRRWVAENVTTTAAAHKPLNSAGTSPRGPLQLDVPAEKATAVAEGRVTPSPPARNGSEEQDLALWV